MDHVVRVTGQVHALGTASMRCLTAPVRAVVVVSSAPPCRLVGHELGQAAAAGRESAGRVQTQPPELVRACIIESVVCIAMSA